MLARAGVGLFILGLQALAAFIFIWGLRIPWRYAAWLIAAFVTFNLSLPYVLWLQTGARQPAFWAAALLVRPSYAWFFNWFSFLVFLAPLIVPVRVISWLIGVEAPVTALRWLVVTVTAVWGGATVVGLYNTTRPPRVVELELALPGLHEDDNGLRIVQLSDSHVAWWNARQEMERIAKIITGLHPDLFVFTGDVVDHHPDYVHVFADCLEGLKPRLGRYAVIGNHDVYTGREEVAARMEQRGFRMLRDECLSLENKGAHLALLGVDDSGQGWTGKDHWEKKIPALVKYCPRGLPIILLAHRPSAFQEVQGLPVALTLCGHTHGGQLGFPWGGPNLADLTFEHSAGLHRSGEQWLYVSSGTGTVGWPFRIACPPEITLITLKSKRTH